MLSVKTPDFVQLNLSILCPVHGFAGNPPLRAGQTSRQVRASPGTVSLLRPTPPGGNFAMGRLPEPDRPRLAADHNRVVPTPHHHSRGTRCFSNGHQMTRRDPLPPQHRELRCVPDGNNPAPGENLAGIL